MPQCIATFDYVQYDGSNGAELADAIATHEVSDTVWTLASDTGAVATVNAHSDADYPYEFTVGQVAVFDGNHRSWSGVTYDGDVFAARFQQV